MTVITDTTLDALAAREITGDDARHVRAFAAFLTLPKNEQGQTVCPPSFHAYALGGPLPPDAEVAAILEPA